MKITEDVRKYAAEHGLTNEEAIESRNAGKDGKNSSRAAQKFTRRHNVRAAHASSVLVSASCRNELFRFKPEKFPQCLRERPESVNTTACPQTALITVDPEIRRRDAGFCGHESAGENALRYLEDNYSLDEFIECFPTVSREMVHRVLEQSKDALLQPA